jgi:hypothetical protein
MQALLKMRVEGFEPTVSVDEGPLGQTLSFKYYLNNKLHHISSLINPNHIEIHTPNGFRTRSLGRWAA